MGSWQSCNGSTLRHWMLWSPVRLVKSFAARSTKQAGRTAAGAEQIRRTWFRKDVQDRAAFMLVLLPVKTHGHTGKEAVRFDALGTSLLRMGEFPRAPLCVGRCSCRRCWCKGGILRCTVGLCWSCRVCRACVMMLLSQCQCSCLDVVKSCVHVERFDCFSVLQQ